MSEVNIELYELMSECEVNMKIDKEEIEIWMHLPFYRCEEFVKAIGLNSFDDGGWECLFQDNNICVKDFQEVIEMEGHLVSSYKNVIDNYEEFEGRVLKIEEEY